MKKNELLKSVKVVILGLILSLSISYAYAAPTAIPPSGNVAGPLNIGPSTQTKQGSFIISNGGFRSAGPALLNDIVIIGPDPSYIQNQSTSFNYQNKKSKGLFAKLGDFFGFTDDSLKTKTALAASPTACANAGGTCVSSTGACTALGGSIVTTSCSPDTSNPLCCDIPVYNAQCGSATGGTYTTTPPTSDLCASGTPYPTPVVGSAPDTNYWKWDCVGINGGTNTSSPFSYACKANKTPVVNGSCGSAVGQTYPSAPSAGLCATGAATIVTASGGGNTGYWQWGCNGSGGGTSTSATACTANKTAIVNGSCGSVNGTTVSSLTSGSANLCSAGVVASFAGNGPWTWGCNGSGPGGTSTSATACSASKTLPPPPAKILTVYGSSELNGALTVSGSISSNNKLVCLQDGTNCPVQGTTQTGGTSLWNLTTSPNIETAMNGSVKITNGILTLGNAGYTVNSDISILKKLKLDNSGGLTSPDLFGATSLTLGNSSAGASVTSGASNTSLRLGGDGKIDLTGNEIYITGNASSSGNGNLIFKDYAGEQGRIAKSGSNSNGISLQSPSWNGGSRAKLDVYGSGAQSVANLEASQIEFNGKVTLNGSGVKINSIGTRPVCTASVAGTFWYVQSTPVDFLTFCSKGITNGFPLTYGYAWFNVNMSN